MRGDLAGDQRLTEPEGRRLPDQAGRHEREDRLGERGVCGRVEPHQDEVVALRDDVLVDLLGALRRDHEVEAELAPLRRDPHCVLGRDRGQRVLRSRRAHVVRLVDHDQDRLALLATLPQAAQDRAGRERLLLARPQRPEVHDDAARSGVVDHVEQRARLAGRPEPQLIDAEVAHAQPQPLRIRTR